MLELIECQIAPMTENHISNQIVDLETTIFPESPFDVQKLLSYYSADYSYVITDNDDIVYAYLFAKPQGSEIYIGNFAVSKPHQGTGIGKKLMNFVITQAECENKSLALRVDKKNLRAIKFYEKVGFVDEGEAPNPQYHCMKRVPFYQNQRIIWIAPRLELERIQAKLPKKAHHKLFMFIDANTDIEPLLGEYDSNMHYQFILSGGHGDFRQSRPTLLIGQSYVTVEQWVQKIKNKGFKFENILLHACLSMGFFPLFSCLSQSKGLIFGHSLTATSDILSLFNNPLELLKDFREHYLADIAKRIDIRDKMANLPLISDVIFQPISKTVWSLDPQGLPRAIQELNESIHVGNIDNQVDYNQLIQYLGENQIIVNTEANSLCAIQEKIDCNDDLIPKDSTNSTNQHAFFKQHTHRINCGITLLGIIAGLIFIGLGSYLIGSAILFSALCMSLIVSMKSIFEQKTPYATNP